MAAVRLRRIVNKNFRAYFLMCSCGMSCCKIMMHSIFSKSSTQTSCLDILTLKAMAGKLVIRVHMQQGIFFALRRLGWNLFYQFRPQGFLTMVDDQTGSMRDICSRLLSQSIAIDERFLCGYRLVIDWPIPIDTN